MNKLISLILILLIIGCSKKKNAIDAEFIEIDKLIALSQEESLAKDDKISYADSIYKKLLKKKKDSLLRSKYFSLANSYFTLYELEKYKQVSELILESSEKEKDTLSIAKAQLYIGDYYFEKAKNDSAYVFYRNAELLFLRLKDNKNLAKVILYKAYILLYEKDYLGSEAETIKALNLSKDDEVFKYECYVNLGSSLSGLENYEKALGYHKKSLAQCENLKKDPLYDVFKAQSLNNIGIVYLKQENYIAAETSFKKGLEVKNIDKMHSLIYASLLDNLAYSKFKLGEESSFQYFSEALKVRDSLKNTSGIIKSNLHLAEYFLVRDKKRVAFNFKAYNLAKKSNYHEDVLKALNLFNKIDSKNGPDYLREYIQLNDSLSKAERESRNKLARIKFETDEIIQEKKVLTGEIKLVFWSSLIIILFIILLYIVLYQRSRQKELIFMQDQQKANEEIYRLMLVQRKKMNEARNNERDRIAKDLHDGIMNRLTSTRLNLFILTRRRDDETINKCINYINDIQNIEKEVRVIAHELSNDMFVQKSGFKNVLKELVQEQNKLFTSKCSCEVDKRIKWDTIEDSIKMNLYRIVQEAFNNCNKYANAQKIKINIFMDSSETKAILLVKDNGVGFNLKKREKGIGVENMKERTKKIGGEFSIISEINKGTSIMVEFPIINKE